MDLFDVMSNFISKSYQCSRWVDIPEMNVGHCKCAWKEMEKVEILVPMRRFLDHVSMAECHADLSQASEKEKYAVDEQRFSLGDQRVRRLARRH